MAALVVGSSSILGSDAGNQAAPWRLIPSAPIKIDSGLTSVWTGKEMIVSGLTASHDGTLLGAVEVAAAYDPATNAWSSLPSPPRIEAYCRRSGVWTGKEMIVSGCGHVAYNPQTNRWRRLPPAPVGAFGLAVWSGRELIGWGGGCCGDAYADGAAYDPARDTWRKLARSPLAPSQSPVGTWTGRELIIFVSGLDPEGKALSGAARAAAYNPATDTWRRLATPPAPRSVAVWSGHEVLLVGGADEAGAGAEVGYAYDPATNRWRSLAAMRSRHPQAVAAWTGGQLLLFGGETTANALLAYDPERNRWSSLPNAPLRERVSPAVVWTGRELVVWGGVIGTPAGTSIAPEHPADGSAFDPTFNLCCRGAQ
ncbi:MAG TPA: hypothetical protein VHK46_08460 [Gaiellaceae bacterium]|nr:hypothetical protein [Gaiellaceae bacterium]